MLACSALKRAHRRALEAGGAARVKYVSDTKKAASADAVHTPLLFKHPHPHPPLAPCCTHTHMQKVLLQPSREELQARLQRRASSGAHFFPPSLLDSQLAALEWRLSGGGGGGGAGDDEGEEEPWALVAPDRAGGAAEMVMPAPDAIADALAERVRRELLS